MIVYLIKILSLFIFLIPVLFNIFYGNFVFDNYFFALIIFGIILFAKHDKSKFQHIIKLSLDKDNIKISKFILLCLFSLFISLLFANYFDFIGLSKRELLRDGSSNFTLNINSFFRIQLQYIFIAFVSHILSKGIINKNTKLIFLGLLFSFLILHQSGTRWLFLLCISPLLTYFYVVSNKVIKLIGTSILIAILTFVSSIRTTAETSLFTVLWWDIPSFQSQNVLNTFKTEFLNIIDFFNGNIFVLIPRFIWPNKPIDSVITEFMISVIGDRFYEGATVLPGFIGSSYLYGSWFGIIIFSLLFRFLIHKLVKWNFKFSSFENLCFISLSILALIMQLRGISVFYFMPLIYYTVALRIRKII